METVFLIKEHLQDVRVVNRELIHTLFCILT